MGRQKARKRAFRLKRTLCTCGPCTEYQRLNSELRAWDESPIPFTTNEECKSIIQKLYFLWTIPHIQEVNERPYYHELAIKYDHPLPEPSYQRS